MSEPRDDGSRSLLSRAASPRIEQAMPGGIASDILDSEACLSSFLHGRWNSAVLKTQENGAEVANGRTAEAIEQAIAALY